MNIVMNAYKNTNIVAKIKYYSIVNDLKKKKNKIRKTR